MTDNGDDILLLRLPQGPNEVPPILPLADDLRIRRLDRHNLVIEKRGIRRTGKHVGEEFWNVQGYYGDLLDALESLPGKVLEPAPLKTLLDQITALRADIRDLSAKLAPPHHPTQSHQTPVRQC